MSKKRSWITSCSKQKTHKNTNNGGINIDTLKASKLLDQSIEANSYSEKLMSLIQQFFRTRKINHYDYEKFVNILTCHQLLTNDIKKKLEVYIVEETNKRIHIDVRV